MSAKAYGLTLALVLTGCAAVPETATPGAASAAATVYRLDAQQTDEASVVQLRPDESDQTETVVCRYMLQPGSNVVVPRCMARAEWDKLERRQIEASRRFLHDALERSTLVGN